MKFFSDNDAEAFRQSLDRTVAEIRAERFWKKYREKFFVPKEKNKKRRKK